MKLCKCIRCKQLFEKRDKSDVPTLFDMPKFSDGLCSNCLFEYFELGDGFKKMAEDFDRGVFYDTEESVEDD